jgi:xanthine dehydrogenase accessory factor
MPDPGLLQLALELHERGEAFALVTVVRAVAPTSAYAGAQAIVCADGAVHGWIGGGCAQPAVIRTVREALADGRARLLRIAPAEQGGQKQLGDVLEFGMACHSGGTLELFVDPVLPRAQLVVIGASPVAASLTQLAPRIGFEVTLVAHEAEASAYPDARRVIASDEPAAAAQIAPGAWVVAATQGRRDVQALRLALALQARQVSFVASAKKAQVLKEALLAGGADPRAVAAIVAPAGYPIAATTPEEIALSVLAAVVSHRRGAMAQAGAGLADGAQRAAATPADSVSCAPAATASTETSGPAPAPGGAPGAGQPSCCGGPSVELPPLPVVAQSCCGH